MAKEIAKHKRMQCKWTRKLSLHMLTVGGVLIGTAMMQSCDKDLLTGQPDWLGNSIYERLQEGIDVNDGSHKTFNYTLRLIDDLGYTSTLSKTGSKTVFATPDDAFEAWLNQKGITYDQLSTNQKKLLFNNAMINNAYLLELMSNVSGTPPETGACMRRTSSATYLDSIPTWSLSDMPDNPMGETGPEDERTMDAWRSLRQNGRDVHVFKDATDPTMIHFLPVFMQNKSITDADLAVISNGQSNSIEDSWINGRKVISSEQTCKNGYVYVVDSVMDFKSNMAQVIHDLPNTKLWAKALDRFSCPVPVTGTALTSYQNLMNTKDTVYNIRYFNSAANHSLYAGGSIEKALNAANVLRFDPGWNQYYTNGQSSSEMYKDAAVMIVPTDEAVNQWLETGEGSDLKKLYGTWENIDISNMATLLSVNMLESFVGSVPSKFDYVLDNTSQRELGITTSDIVRCYMCCNGVIYLVNKVFTPDEYSAVIYPAKIQVNGYFSVIAHALYGNYTASYAKEYDFSPYLGALDSKFELFIPYNTTLSSNSQLAEKNTTVVTMIDPCSYGLNSMRVFEFYYSGGTVQGNSYPATLGSDGNLTIDYNNPTGLSTNVVKNRLNDMIDNNIIVGTIKDGQDYYITKAGSILYAKKTSGGMNVKGGYQMETGETIFVPDSCITPKGNGNTYGVCSAYAQERTGKEYGIPMTAQSSVYQILKNESEAGKKCSKFLELLENEHCGILESSESGYSCVGGSTNYNVSLFDSYNYTVYVPTDEAIENLINSGYLPTWEDYTNAGDESGEENASQTAIKNRIVSFLRYHFQDNAVMVGGESVNTDYETGKLNSATGRFFTLGVSGNDGNGLTVTDASGVSHKILTSDSDGFYNKVAREYWISGSGTSSLISSSSNAAVHMIDGVLRYDKDSSSWRTLISSGAKRARIRRK